MLEEVNTVDKFLSRKFLISIAASLGSIGTSIAGLAIAEPTIAAVGIICTVLSAAIYSATEAWVDQAAASTNSTSTVKTITATADSASIVKSAIQPTENKTTDVK